VIALLLAAAAAAPPAPAPTTPPPPPAPASVTRVADGWRADLYAEGTLAGWALPRGRDGRRSVVLLVGPDPKSKPRTCGPVDTAPASVKNRLYRWRPEAPETLETLSESLPEGTLEAADLDRDGEDELFLVRAGAVDRLRVDAGGTHAVALVADDDIARSCCTSRSSRNAAGSQDRALRVDTVGAFRTYGPGPDGSLAIVSEQGLPRRVSQGSERISVASSGVEPIGLGANGRMLYATDPEPMGPRRLRALLLDPDGPADSRSLECWAQLPEPERVVDSGFVMLDHVPTLVIATTSAEKLSLFGEKGLRIYPLTADRTRMGGAATFAATTGINLWQQAIVSAQDLDGDGHDDLALAYWKGLKDSIAALEIYPGGPKGFSKSRTLTFDVPAGERHFLDFAGDADGDGRPDLLLFAAGELLVFPGAPAASALDKPVASKPSRRIPLPGGRISTGEASVEIGLGGFQVSRRDAGFGMPHLVDLDADGRREILLGGTSDGARVSVLFVRGGAALASASGASYK